MENTFCQKCRSRSICQTFQYKANRLSKEFDGFMPLVRLGCPVALKELDEKTVFEDFWKSDNPELLQG